ncbi:hypothetical protein CGRA01v4_01782 [Colletotrichum graminicola]|nr:hypothetical protein CGRA01v4_01782 [Colletotrichum graminicola]
MPRSRLSAEISTTLCEAVVPQVQYMMSSQRNVVLLTRRICTYLCTN